MAGADLSDPEVRRLSLATGMHESDTANAVFPGERIARVDLHLTSGKTLSSDWHHSKWDPGQPPTPAQFSQKFHRYCAGIIPAARAKAIEAAVEGVPRDGLSPLLPLLYQPISALTASDNAP